MTPKKFKIISNALLKKHFMATVDDVGFSDAVIGEFVAKGVRPHEAISQAAEVRSLGRRDGRPGASYGVTLGDEMSVMIGLIAHDGPSPE